MKKFPLVIAAIALIVAAFAFLAYALFNNQPEETPKADVYFCPQDDCFSLIANLISNASKADCALYTLNSDEIESALKAKNARVVVDEKCPEGTDCREKPYRQRGLMHDKFCILDDSITITGSFNPNENSKSYRNNVVIIYSESIAKEYADEFTELWKGKFGSGGKSGSKTVFFCPEDNCQQHLIEEIGKAEKSIYFMVYSFTDNDIADELLKITKEGVTVRGFFDKSQNSKWSVYPMLEGKADARVYAEGVLHHKVFIIDNETVITGSYNPTQNGNEYNDENMVILHDRQIASFFLAEFSRISNPKAI